MKAVLCNEYGLPEDLPLAEIEKPVPKDDEVLVEVHASCVTTATLFQVTGKPFFVRLMVSGLGKPTIKIPGSDVAGRVAAVGRNVKQFKPGDDVFGLLFASGAFAEYVCAPENALALMPADLPYAEAAAVPEAALVALQGLRDKGHIQKGQQVLIYGASGGIGTFAVQIAKYYGAEVTAVCSTKNLDLVRSLGADHVVDYTYEDYTKTDQHYDLIFAIAYRSIFAHLRALNSRGIYVSTGGPSIMRIVQDMLIGSALSRDAGKKVAGGWMVELSQKDLAFMKDLIEAGRVKPVIDRVYPFGDVADAFRYYADGHARGKVIITIRRD